VLLFAFVRPASDISPFLLCCGATQSAFSSRSRTWSSGEMSFSCKRGCPLLRPARTRLSSLGTRYVLVLAGIGGLARGGGLANASL
jgi:hypothetical protein